MAHRQHSSRALALVEKYDVEAGATVGGGGGESPLQDGFGWTNGVTLMLLDRFGGSDAGAASEWRLDAAND